MLEFKNTGRARVVNALDGRVIKCYYGSNADKRFRNERRVLTHLNDLECPFVPELLDSNASRLSITLEHCGAGVEYLPDQSIQILFERLLPFGVRHNDPAVRNVLYDSRRSDFTLIDFELAEIINAPFPVSAPLKLGIRQPDSWFPNGDVCYASESNVRSSSH